MKKKLLAAACFLSLGFIGGQMVTAQEFIKLAGLKDSLQNTTIYTAGMKSPETGFAADYLISHFAQTQNDWTTAYTYLDRALSKKGQSDALKNRAMLLAIGSGKIDKAAAYAKEIITREEDNRLAYVVLAVDAQMSDKPEEALEYLTKMPSGDVTDFVKPLLQGWANASLGKLDVDDLKEGSFHLYHGALIAYHLGEKEKARELIGTLVDNKEALSPEQIIRSAVILMALGDRTTSQSLLALIDEHVNTDPRVGHLAEALKADPDSSKPLIIQNSVLSDVQSAKDGAAQAIYDMSLVLYQEGSISSARLFINLALGMNPDMVRANVLLAEALIDSELYMEAREYLLNIPEGHPLHLKARRQAASLLADAGDIEGAQQELKALFKDHNNIEAMIDVGHLYRQQEDYGNALKIYNKAATAIGENIPEEYWYLLYARGMAHERLGNWTKAVEDLNAALSYRPNHPFLLNYLGYGWADKGENLEKALTLLKKAASLQPRDGYIIDSLGWVYYRTGDYKQAIQYLEKAVEYLPYDPTINDHLGDAYWQVGRKLEARFQWERAVNNTEDHEVELREKIEKKLAGKALPDEGSVKKAETKYNQ